MEIVTIKLPIEDRKLLRIIAATTDESHQAVLSRILKQEFNNLKSKFND